MAVYVSSKGGEREKKKGKKRERQIDKRGDGEKGRESKQMEVV